MSSNDGISKSNENSGVSGDMQGVSAAIQGPAETSVSQNMRFASASAPQDTQYSQKVNEACEQYQATPSHVALNQLYMNPNNTAAQAFAAAAMAAQQVVQAQMGITAPVQQAQTPPNLTTAVQGTNIGLNQAAAALPVNMITNGTNANPNLNGIGTPLTAIHHALQNGSSAQSFQQQTAAILAASSIGSNVLDHSQNNSVPAMAAAQAFALILQQQQAQVQAAQNHMHPQTQKQNQLVSSTLLQAPTANSQQMQQHPQLVQSKAPNRLNPQHSLQSSNTQSPQSSFDNESTQQLKSPPHNGTIQYSKSKQHHKKRPASAIPERELPNVLQTSNLPPAHHVKYAPVKVVPTSISSVRPSQPVPLSQVRASPFQIPVSTPPISAPITPAHHNAIGVAQHTHKNLFQAAMNPIVLSQMQSWKLNQLESHVQLLNDTSQPIPQPVQILLAEARRLEEKRAAKRIANRKSACTSRARKKALVAEMTKTNARLRRQAIILSLLPDLVVAIKDDGMITFCSAQVERVLRHKLEDLVGANIGEILTPSSRTALTALIGKLVAAEKAALEDGNNKEGDESGRSSNSGNTGTSQAAIVSEQSDNFPLSVVKVKSHKPTRRNEASDSSGNGNAINDAPLSHAAQSSLTNQSNSDGSTNQHSNDASTGAGGSNSSIIRKGAANSDADCSSSSSDTKNLSEANEALNRNVRFHNEQLKIKKESKKKCIAHKDDVTGDSVTANNADARLSSLMKQRGEDEQSGVDAVKKGISSLENLEVSSSSSSTDSLLAGVEDRHKKRKRTENNVSDDSGYRESGESDPSREDSASSTSDTSNGGRRRPLAPTCNICLIRNDLSTIWCEVTSSIRTRSVDEEQPDVSSISAGGSSAQKKSKIASSSSSVEHQSSSTNSMNPQIKELLLCLRPIRDGVEKVSEDLRFVPCDSKDRSLAPKREKKVEVHGSGLFTDATPSRTAFRAEVHAPSTRDSNLNERRPMKKRAMDGIDAHVKSIVQAAPKKQTIDEQENDAEKSVVESLILMSSN